MHATSYMQSLGMRTLLYIEDRMAAESKLGRGIWDENQESDVLNGEAVVSILFFSILSHNLGRSSGHHR